MMIWQLFVCVVKHTNTLPLTVVLLGCICLKRRADHNYFYSKDACLYDTFQDMIVNADLVYP